MIYDFDKITDRTGSGDLKHEVLEERYGRKDLLPLWVADMDFETPEFITAAIRQRLTHSLFGYTVEPKEYRPTIQQWIRQQHHWEIKKEWLTYVPGVVKGIGMVINVFTQPGDKVIIQPPVYHPFRLTPQRNDRQVVFNPLKQRDDGLYDMDFEQLAEITDEHCKLLILCNPHNPGGVVWSRDTLIRLAEFCYAHHIFVISDEIHADLTLFGHQHIPFAAVSKEAEQISITFQAPTKTFNMAGIVSSYAIVPNDTIRRRLFRWMEANELNEPDIFAPIATIAAYKSGGEWRRQMLDYIEQNILFTEQFVTENIHGIRVIRPEASFLVWLDCRGLNLDHQALLDLFINKAHLALNDGEMFGVGTNPNVGCGYMRLNVGTPRTILNQALEQLKSAVSSI
jgi:cystathionine beta-lyase